MKGLIVVHTGDNHAPAATGPVLVDRMEAFIGKLVGASELLGHGGLDEPVR